MNSTHVYDNKRCSNITITWQLQNVISETCFKGKAWDILFNTICAINIIYMLQIYITLHFFNIYRHRDFNIYLHLSYILPGGSLFTIKDFYWTEKVNNYLWTTCEPMWEVACLFMSLNNVDIILILCNDMPVLEQNLHLWQHPSSHL